MNAELRELVARGVGCEPWELGDEWSELCEALGVFLESKTKPSHEVVGRLLRAIVGTDKL